MCSIQLSKSPCSCIKRGEGEFEEGSLDIQDSDSRLDRTYLLLFSLTETEIETLSKTIFNSIVDDTREDIEKFWSGEDRKFFTSFE